MILLDTDILTLLAYGNLNIRKRIDETEEELAITIVTRNEVVRGRADQLLKAADEEELRKAVERFRRAEEFLADFVVVGLDETAVLQFGKLRKQKNLKKIGRADLLNACVALANDALLVTRNLKDYKDVVDLRLAHWAD